MDLKKKLLLRSTLIFAFTLGFVALGTYLLFKYYTTQLYNKKLTERAKLAAYYHLEKDELSERRYKEIEDRYREISNESIRLYYANNKTIYVDDSLEFVIPKQRLQHIINSGTQSFNINGRQFVAFFYKDNQGDFVIVASGIDSIGQAQMITLRWMLLAFCLIGLSIHFFLTNILAKKTFQPFSNLIDTVNSIKPNNLSMRFEIAKGKQDEMTKLMETFNYFLERLERSMEMQQHFLKNVSHELKTPLTVLIGDIEVGLNQVRSNEKYQEILLSIKNGGLHLKSILEGLLTISSLDIPMNHQMQPLRIDEVLWEVLDKKSIEYPHAKVSIDFKSVDDIQNLLMVNGNKHLLFIAFNNVIDNAIKFSEPHPITIIAEVVANQLVISIIDKGVGILPEEQENIFKLFYRSNLNNHITGHGIGLYLTKQILSLHHIQLNVSSIIGKETSVSFIFPIGISV